VESIKEGGVAYFGWEDSREGLLMKRYVSGVIERKLGGG